MSGESTDSPARRAATELVARLRDEGHEAYLAGGCVRDHLLGRRPKDYDIATSATPEALLASFPRAHRVGAHFGVVMVPHRGEMTEIATFRRDGVYADGRRPDSVTFTDAREDTQRRDFTINGLFEDPASGELLDYVGGQRDLENRVIRAIGDPESRFREDALRLLRAVRFATVLDFEIEPGTWQALAQQAERLGMISPERIRDEFSKLLTSRHRARGVKLLVDSGLMRTVMPEVLDLVGCEQPPEWHPEGDVFTHTIIMLDMLAADAPLELCLAVLLHDIGKPATQAYDPEADRIRFNGHDAVGAQMAETMLRRLRYPNRVLHEVGFMVSRHMRFMHVQQMREAKLKRFMDAPTFPRELELHRVDCGSSNGFTDNYEFLLAKREEFAREPLVPPPLITGRDLIELGLTPGPAFASILAAAQTEQLERRLTTREEALAWLRQHYG